jgi:hypothetical protein
MVAGSRPQTVAKALLKSGRPGKMNGGRKKAIKNDGI